MAACTRSSGKKLRSRVVVKLHPTNVKFRVSNTRASKRKEENKELIEILSDEEELQPSLPNKVTHTQSNIMAAAGSDDMTMSVLKAEWNEVQRKLRQADLTAEILLKAHRTIEAKDRAIQLLTSQIDTAKKNIKSTHERLLDHLVCFTCGELLRDPYILPSCGHTFCYSCIMTWGDACGRARAQLVSLVSAYLFANSIHDLPQRGETIDPAEPPFYLKCPTCRVHEDNPIQNFFVKSLVAALAREEIL